MKEIKAYKTTDGRIWEDPKEAEIVQTEIDWDGWYDKNKLYGNCDGSYCRWSDLVCWILENRDVVLKILNVKQHEIKVIL